MKIFTSLWIIPGLSNRLRVQCRRKGPNCCLYSIIKLYDHSITAKLFSVPARVRTQFRRKFLLKMNFLLAISEPRSFLGPERFPLRSDGPRLRCLRLNLVETDFYSFTIMLLIKSEKNSNLAADGNLQQPRQPYWFLWNMRVETRPS